MVLAVGGLLALPPVVHASRCNQVSVIQDVNGGGETFSDLSDTPVRICSVEFTAFAAGGYATVFDSPDDTLSHAQMQIKSEPGAATAGNSEQRWYGEEGIPTRHGLDVQVYRGTAVVLWAGASP